MNEDHNKVDSSFVYFKFVITNAHFEFSGKDCHLKVNTTQENKKLKAVTAFYSIQRSRKKKFIDEKNTHAITGKHVKNVF